jgi:hypothetical protein
MDMNFFMHEELALLSIDEGKKRARPRFKGPFFLAYATALLSELSLLSRIAIDADGRVIELSNEVVGSWMLDGLLAQIHAQSGKHTAKHWIGAMSAFLGKAVIMDSLAAKGVYRNEGRKWYRSAESRSEAKGALAEGIRERLRRLVFTQGPQTLRDITMLGILRQAGLSGLVFSRGELRVAEYIVKLLSHPDEIEKALASLLKGRKAS